MHISGYKRKKWVHKDDTAIDRTVKFPLKRHIWGCFYRGGLCTIEVFSENMNTEKYIQILTENLIPFLDASNQKLIFQHDNDPTHTAKATKKFLMDSKVNVLEWPSNSPDLNPIENLWSQLKLNVSKCKSINTKDFVCNIFTEWNDFSIKYLEALIDSMPTRIKKLIENKGDCIMY